MQLSVADHPRISGVLCVDIYRWTANFVERQRIGIIIYIHKPAGLELLEVVQTIGLPAFGFGSAKNRQQKRREDADNGNHHQKFNKRKTATISPGTASSPLRHFNRLSVHTQNNLNQVAEICHVVRAKT